MDPAEVLGVSSGNLRRHRWLFPAGPVRLPTKDSSAAPTSAGLDLTGAQLELLVDIISAGSKQEVL